MTQRRGKSIFLRKPFAVAGRLVGTALGYLLTNVFIQGLTTTAGIWMTAAIGVAVGLGSLGVAVLSTLFTLISLALAGRYEFRAGEEREADRKGQDSD